MTWPFLQMVFQYFLINNSEDEYLVVTLLKIQLNLKHITSTLQVDYTLITKN